MFEIRTVHSISLLKVIEKSSFESVSMVLKIYMERRVEDAFSKKNKEFLPCFFLFCFWLFLIFIF